MSELPDVAGGETITAARDNQVKERSAMRYASAAARDTSIPAPVAGSLAYLQDVSELTVYDGANWITFTIPADLIAGYLALDVSNGPLTDSLVIQGFLSVLASTARIILASADQSEGWRFLSQATNGVPGELFIQTVAGGTYLKFNLDGSIVTEQTVTAGLRNVIQGTVPPTTEGIDGDMYLEHEA